MALPVNIDELVHGHTIEWERLEFKEGWNPEDVIHSMCAFANDLHNWGGGYIIMGVGEQEGQPILPPAGLQANQLDPIQKKILELGHKIQPNYLPAHDAIRIEAGNGVKYLLFNTIDELIAFANGASNQAGNQAGRPAMDIISTQIHGRVVEMLEILNERMRRADLFDRMDLSNQSRNRARYLDPLLEIGWVSMEFPEERTHPNQTYQTTQTGRRILDMISQQ